MQPRVGSEIVEHPLMSPWMGEGPVTSPTSFPTPPKAATAGRPRLTATAGLGPQPGPQASRAPAPSLRVSTHCSGSPVGKGDRATEPQTRFFGLPSPCSSLCSSGFALAPTSRPSYVGICRQLTLTVLAVGTASTVGVGRELMVVGWG